MKAELQSFLAMLESEPDNQRALEALEALAPQVKEGNGVSGEAAARALANARRVHRERNDWDLVARLLDLELSWTTDASRRADLLYEKGRVLSDELLRDEDAVGCFQKVLEIRSDDSAAQEVLSHLALLRENWEAVSQRYLSEAKAAGADKQLQTSLFLSVAELYLKYSPEPETGESYLRRVLEHDPRNRKASAHLERRLRARSAWTELESLLSRRSEIAQAKDERAQALVQLAEIEERRGDRGRALEGWKKVLSVEPANPRALRALVDALTADGDWGALVKVYETALRARPRGEHELALVLQIGMLYWKKLSDLDSAEPFFRRVRKAEPTHPSALEFYRAFFGARGEGQKLLAVLQAAAKVETDPARRFALACEMARAAEKESGAGEKSIDLWKVVLRMDPKHAEGAQALRRLYRKTEKWNALLELLKDEIEALPKDAVVDKIALHLEVVEIYRDRLGLDVMVIGTYQNILALDPRHEGALQALADKYESLGRWNDLIGILARRAEASSDRAQKVALLRRIAALWLDKFANANQAARPLEEILTLAPEDPGAIAQLRDIYAKRRSWRALLDLDRRELGRLRGDERRARLAGMARLAAERLGDSREAIALWNEVLSQNESDGDALAALVSLYEREKRWPALVEVLRRQAAAAAPAARVPLFERLGVLFLERLDAPERAAAAYREILSVQPGHAKAQRTLRELYASEGDFASLERLYSETGQWEELAETLLQVVDRAADTAERLQLLRRIAEICIQRLGKPERAVKSYERILALDPGNLDSARALVPIYQATEKWARLLATLEILLQHADQRSERLQLLGEIRGICEQRLGSKGMAFQWCAKAYELAPDEPQVVADLERLADEAGAWDELVGLYSRRAEALAGSAEEVPMYRRLARIAREKIGNPAEARRFWEEVLSRAPTDGEALQALEQIFTQQSAWPELVQVYRRRVESESDPARRLEITERLAFLEEERLTDLAAATQSWRRVVESAGVAAAPREAGKALAALERIHTARREWPELAAVLEERLALCDGDEQKAALHVQLGSLYERELGDAARALVCYRQALGFSPQHRGAIAALERFLDHKEHQVEAARLLSPLYETESDPARLARLYEVLLGAERRDVDRLAVSRRLAQLYAKKLGEPEKAYVHAARVLERQPEDLEIRRLLFALAEQLECWENLGARLEQAAKVAELAGDAATDRQICFEIAELYDQKLGRFDRAAEFYARAGGEDQMADRAFDSLLRIYRQGEKWMELRALLDSRQKRLPDPERRKELLFQICDLDEGVLEDQDAATGTYREILAIDPGNVRAFKALERVLALRESWPELDALLQQELSQSGGIEESAALRFKRAELRATKLGDLPGAVDLLEEVLSAQPGHEGARKVLERLMGRAELRQRVARVLEPYYEKDEAWAKLVAVLQVRREEADGDAARELVAQIAELQEHKLTARQAALLTWREALRLDAADARARGEVERLGTMLEKWNDLAQAWEECVGLVPPADLALRAEYLERAARVYDERLGDAARAQGAWRRLLDLDPQNLATAQPAAEALAALYERAGAWTDLVGILRQKVEWEPAREARRGLLVRIARIQEEALSDPKAAIGTYREVLELEPDDRVALDSLERLYGAGSSWRDQIGVLKRRVDLARDVKQRRDLHWRMAEIEERELGAAAEAVASYLAILDETPEDLPALAALARLYEAQGRFADLREVLVRQLALVRERAGKLELLHRLAQLAEEKLGRLDAAVDRWQEILGEFGSDDRAVAGLERALGDEALKLRAAEILEPIFRQRGDLSKQIALFELLADSASDPEARVARLEASAALREKIGDMEGAFDTYARAARSALGGQELPRLCDALERLAIERRRQGDLVELYRDVGGDVLDPEAQQRMYLAVADQARTKLGDPAMAREYYRRVLDAAPDHPRALVALEGLYLESQDWEPLFDIYQKRGDLAQDPDEKRDYLSRAAAVCEDKLGRPQDAISLYEQILELRAGDREAMSALERLYADGDRPADLADLLERRLGFAEDLEEAVRLRFRLGELYERVLRDPDRAVENYRATLGGEPSHAGAIAALERYLEDPAQQGAAAEVLEPVYAARQAWPKLVRIYEIRLVAAEEPKLRLQLTRRIARLYEEQLEDLEQAFKWYGKVFRESPEDRAARDQLVRLAGILERWRDLAEVYQSYLDDTLEPGPAFTAVCWTLAGLYDEKLGEVDRAKECYLRLLEADPADARVFDALERSLVRAKRWRDVLDLYEQRAAKETEPKARRDLFIKICKVHEESLQDRDEAIAAWRRVLDLDPDDAAAQAALDRLLVADGRWHDLVELVSRKLERAEGAEYLAQKVRLGQIFEQNLDDPSAAIDAYEECLARDPQHRESLAALERLAQDRDHRFRIAQILEPLYKAQDEWGKLIVIYGAELEFIEDPPRRVEILREVARLHEQRASNLPFAWEAMSRAFAEDATNEEVLTDLERLSFALDRTSDLVTVLEKAAEQVYDPVLARNLFARAAAHYAERLKNPEAAISAWRRVLQASGDDPEALSALEKLLEGERSWEELVEVIERRSDLSDDAELRKMLLYRAAEIEEKTLERRERAVELWQRVLGLDEADSRALEALARLHESAGDYRALAEIVGRQIELMPQGFERRALQFKLADVYEQKIEDRFEAIGCYKAVREANPDDASALAALDRLYQAEQMWSDLLEVLEIRIRLAEDTAAREELRFRAARVLESETGDVDSALGRYQKVLEALPEHAGAREALFALVRAEGTREQAAAALEPYLKGRKEWERLCEIGELRLESEGDATRRRQLLADLAALHETGRGDLQAAFAAWGRALGEDAGDAEVQRQLERIAGARGAFADLAALYEDRLQNQYDAEIGRSLALKLATIYEDALGDAAQAVDRLRMALDFPGEERGPLAALDRLLESLGRWGELAEVLEREAQASADPAEQAGFLYRMGAVRVERLTDPEGAISAWREVLEHEPAEPRAVAGLSRYLEDATYREQVIDILEPVFEGAGDARRLVNLYEVKLQITDEPLERARLLERIAELAEKSLGAPAEALDAFARALAEDPAELRYAEEIVRLGESLGKQAEAATRLEAVADGAVERSREASRDLSLRAAAIWLEQAQELGRAELRFKKVLDLDRENAEALAALDRVYRARGDDSALVQTLRQRADIELDAVRKRTFLAEAAGLAERRLKDVPAAIAAWKAALDSDESDAPALAELGRLHESRGEWAELADTLERRARLGEASAQSALYAQAGAVYAERLGDADRASDAYRAALDADPQSRAILSALEEIHTRREDWLAVQEVLTQQLASAQEPQARVEIYAKLARLAEERRESPDEAVGFWSQALEADPQSEAVLGELERLLGSTEKWYELADVLGKHAEALGARGDGAGELQKLLEVADLWERRVGSAETAVEMLEKVLEKNPREVSAITRLARLYEAAGEWDKCAAALERAAALGPTGTVAAELHYRIGRVEAQRSGDEAKAEGWWTRAIELDPTHAEALSALERVARGRADWARVVELAVLREKGEADPQKKRELLAEIARILRSELKKPADAVPYLERATKLSPEDAKVVEPLADAYFEAGRLAEAGQLYVGLLERHKGRKTKDVARLEFRMGRISEQEGREGEALEHFGHAFAIDPTHGATMAALGRLYVKQSDWEKARKVFRSMLLQSLDHDAGISKADVYFELGRIHAQLGEGPKARNMYERGLELDPAHARLKQALAELSP